MSKGNIICDLDGVVCQYDFAEITRKRWGMSIPNKGIYCYSIEDALGVSAREVQEVFEAEIFSPPNFIPGAVQTLKWLIASDYNIQILTNRLHFIDKDKLSAWMEKYGIPYHDVIDFKSLPNYAHAMIDDSPTKLMNVADETKVNELILFSNPWNEHCLNVHGRLVRARNWAEVRRIIEHVVVIYPTRTSTVPEVDGTGTKVTQRKERGLRKGGKSTRELLAGKPNTKPVSRTKAKRPKSRSSNVHDETTGRRPVDGKPRIRRKG